MVFSVAAQRTFWSIFFTIGITLSLVIYGLLQERIMSIPYGDSGDLFDVAVSLVFWNRVSGLLVACAATKIRGESFVSNGPWRGYALISFANVVATYCQYEALDYVSFALQVIGKSFKMIPVMIWGRVVSHKTFPISVWVVALCITAGTVLYVTGGDVRGSNTNSTLLPGVLLILTFLAFDGLQTTYQEKIFKEYKPTTFEQMRNVNIVSSFLCLSILIPLNYFPKVYYFATEHPRFVADVAVLSTAAAASQWFIYSLIHSDGALAVAVAINVRQVISIVSSYIAYHHPITSYQILALTGIIIALLYKSISSFLDVYVDQKERMPILQKDALNV